MVFSPCLQKSAKRDARVLLNCPCVRFFLVANLKTGMSSSKIPANVCFLFKALRAATGQHWKPEKGKRSTNSQISPDFGCFILRRRDVGDDSRMSCQVRSESGAWVNSPLAKISPIRVDAKKLVVEAAQMTCLVRGDQLVLAILCPSCSRRGKVTTRRVLL